MLKKLIVALVALMLFLFPLQVMAFELHYEGKKEFWMGFSRSVGTDFQDQPYQDRDWAFGQSLEIRFNGQDELGYIRGYITDYPQLMDQVFIDMALGNYKLQWDKYDRVFLYPSWFNLEHKFTGLRLNYLGERDAVTLLGVRGDNFFREENRILNAGDERMGISLRHAPVALNSVRLWLNGMELQYGGDFVLDPIVGVINLKIPIRETSHLQVRYLQEGQSYMVLGGRYEHFFDLPIEGQDLIGGVVLLHARGDDEGQSLIGTELFYQPAPWWSVSLNTGLVQRRPDGIIGLWTDSYSPQVLEVTNGKVNEAIGMDFNWRMAHNFNWDKISLGVDYQSIQNNFQNILYGGEEGRILTLTGEYTGDQLFLKHMQNYQWGIDGEPIEKMANLEALWLDQNWIPYIYYSRYEREGLTRQQGIAELGYLTDYEWGALTYLMGVDVKSSPEDEGWLQDAEPYLGVRFQHGPRQSVGARVYGKQGLEFAQMALFGDWEHGLVSWNGQLNVLPGFYRMKHDLNLPLSQLTKGLEDEFPVDIQMSLLQHRFFEGEQEYLNLSLNLDLTPATGVETFLNLNMLKEKVGDETIRTYHVGGEQALSPNLFGYGEIGIGSTENSYTAGVRGGNYFLGYDLNYTRTNFLGDDLFTRNHVGFSVGTIDIWSFSGHLEVDKYQLGGELDIMYPILPSVDLGARYSGYKVTESTPFVNHQLIVRTVYRF